MRHTRLGFFFLEITHLFRSYPLLIISLCLYLYPYLKHSSVLTSLTYPTQTTIRLHWSLSPLNSILSRIHEIFMKCLIRGARGRMTRDEIREAPQTRWFKATVMTLEFPWSDKKSHWNFLQGSVMWLTFKEDSSGCSVDYRL